MIIQAEKKEKKIFLILCVMRSGSTYLTTLLNKFPEISSDYEFQWKPTFRTFTNLHKIIPSFRADVKVMMEKSFEDKNTPIIGSKVVFSGSRKYSRLDFTDLGIAINKDIKIIYLKRRPKDIVLSMIKNQGHNIKKTSDFSKEKNIILESIKDDNIENQSLKKFEFNINILINNFLAIKQNQKNIKKFCEKHKNYIEIKYEDLVCTTKPELERLCQFLGENYDPEMLQFQKVARSSVPDYKVAWHGATREPLNRQSVKRWERDLSDDEVSLIEWAVGDDLAELGYSLSRSDKAPTLEAKKYYKQAKRKFRFENLLRNFADKLISYFYTGNIDYRLN